jgi:hypothetical protein
MEVATLRYQSTPRPEHAQRAIWAGQVARRPVGPSTDWGRASNPGSPARDDPELDRLLEEARGKGSEPPGEYYYDMFGRRRLVPAAGAGEEQEEGEEGEGGGDWGGDAEAAGAVARARGAGDRGAGGGAGAWGVSAVAGAAGGAGGAAHQHQAIGMHDESEPVQQKGSFRARKA